jgi:hypothetical protein
MILMLSCVFVTGVFADENEAKGVQPRVAIQAAPQKWLFEAGGRRRFKFSSVNQFWGWWIA